MTTLINAQDLIGEQKSYVVGKLENGKITYQDDNVQVAIIIESDKMSLIRENEESLIKLTFDQANKTVGSYLLKKNNFTLPLEVNTKLVNIKEQGLEVNYYLNDSANEVIFKLEYEVIYES